MTARPPATLRKGEGPTWTLRDGRTIAPVLLSELPHEIPFGGLGRLLSTSETVEFRLEAHRIPHARSLEILQVAQSVAEAELSQGDGGNDARPAEMDLARESAASLGRQVAQRTQELWHVGLSFEALGATRPRAERARSALLRRLSTLGFRTRIPTYQASDASLPPEFTGNEARPPGYWHTLHTDGVAAFFPFVDETVAEPGGILIGLLLDDATPIFLDRWNHASYSWGIFGTTGSGKSFAAGLYALRTIWMRPDVEVVLLDPLGEFGALARLLGGSVVALGDPTKGRLNPLDPTTSGDRAEKSSRVGAILRALFPSLLDEEAAALDTAVNRLYERGPAIPIFSDLLEELEKSPADRGRLLELLEVFRSGSLRHLNGPTTVDWGSSPIVVDFQGVSEAHLPFHLAYVLDSVYARLRDRPGPKLLVVDEAHLLVRHPATAEFLDRLVRHVRHFEAGVLLLSQHPDDFLGNPSGRSLLRNLRATLLLRLTNVSSETRAFFGLTDAEVDWLLRARLPKEAGYSEGLLRCGAPHLPLAVVASTPEYEFLAGLLGLRETSGIPPEGAPTDSPPTPRL